MRFNLELFEIPNSERLFLNLLSRQPHSYGPIRAIFDTGSPVTIISARDALQLNIPLANTENGDSIRGFGRGQIPSKRLNKFIFALKSEDSKIKYIEMPVNVVDISRLRSLHHDFQSTAMQLPTIIGMDFLRISKMKLFVDLFAHKAILEE